MVGHYSRFGYKRDTDFDVQICLRVLVDTAVLSNLAVVDGYVLRHLRRSPYKDNSNITLPLLIMLCSYIANHHIRILPNNKIII